MGGSQAKQSGECNQKKKINKKPRKTLFVNKTECNTGQIEHCSQG